MPYKAVVLDIPVLNARGLSYKNLIIIVVPMHEIHSENSLFSRT